MSAKKQETAWVIERYINSVLHYWNPSKEFVLDERGIFNVADLDNDFTTDPDDAVRFSRYVDGMIILQEFCDGIGRVTEHMWLNTDHLSGDRCPECNHYGPYPCVDPNSVHMYENCKCVHPWHLRK